MAINYIPNDPNVAQPPLRSIPPVADCGAGRRDMRWAIR